VICWSRVWTREGRRPFRPKVWRSETGKAEPLLSLGFLRRMGPWWCQFGGRKVFWRGFLLTVKEHSLAPEVALGKWLNLLEEAMIAVCCKL
jgi:hypothetical protein